MAEPDGLFRSKHGLGLLFVLGCSFAAAIGGIYYSYSQPTPVAPAKNNIVATASRPDEGYVGSKRCAECHQEVYSSYQTHSMAHSCNAVSDAKPIEQFENAEFHPPGMRHYRVEKDDHGFWHEEIAADDEGRPIYTQRVPVTIALGSGQHGRTYLLDHDGLLFQSAIGWYSQGQKWDLSPGYDPDKHQRFSRRIVDGCLFCHVGRVNEVKRGSDRYQSPRFLEASIGCERCHGPGRKHIERHESGHTATGIDDTIVNPARLDPERREAVCNQCHLQGTQVVLRRDSQFWDFRPGQTLDDVYLVFLMGNRTDESGNAHAVSQVEQMHESKCYQASGQKLGCISCHDAHFLPAKSERDVYYRQRCLECHGVRQCSLPEAKQQEQPANGSCIACHMPRLHTQDVPHTAQTDHRVLRHSSQNLSPPISRSSEKDGLRIFGNSEIRVPKQEIDRAKGILMAEFARSRMDKKLAETARNILLPGAANNLDPSTLNSLGKDLNVLETLGGLYDLAEQPYSAITCWEQVLRFEPEKESVLASLADLCLRHGNLEGAEGYLVRLLKINPSLSDAHFRLADLLLYKGDVAEALRAGEKSLELDPSEVRVREWLVKAYLVARMPDKSREQAETLDRLRKAKKKSETK